MKERNFEIEIARERERGGEGWWGNERHGI